MIVEVRCDSIEFESTGKRVVEGQMIRPVGREAMTETMERTGRKG